mmetsp:Transcript_28414/g.62462  ORF Transcript_28414/g.62462 Transcript_28414/m.62462 type:complete len:215 (+) Transcript_28414:823-1467(+)
MRQAEPKSVTLVWPGPRRRPPWKQGMPMQAPTCTWLRSSSPLTPARASHTRLTSTASACCCGRCTPGGAPGRAAMRSTCCTRWACCTRPCPFPYHHPPHLPRRVQRPRQQEGGRPQGQARGQGWQARCLHRAYRTLRQHKEAVLGLLGVLGVLGVPPLHPSSLQQCAPSPPPCNGSFSAAGGRTLMLGLRLIRCSWSWRSYWRACPAAERICMG